MTALAGLSASPDRVSECALWSPLSGELRQGHGSQDLSWGTVMVQSWSRRDPSPRHWLSHVSTRDLGQERLREKPTVWGPTQRAGPRGKPPLNSVSPSSVTRVTPELPAPPQPTTPIPPSSHLPQLLELFPYLRTWVRSSNLKASRESSLWQWESPVTAGQNSLDSYGTAVSWQKPVTPMNMLRKDANQGWEYHTPGLRNYQAFVLLPPLGSLRFTQHSHRPRLIRTLAGAKQGSGPRWRHRRLQTHLFPWTHQINSLWRNSRN